MKAQRASSHPKHTLRNVIKKAKNPKWHGHNKSLLSDDHKQSLSLTSARYENQMGHSGKSSLKSQRRQYAKAVSGRTVSSPLTAAPRVKALAAHINGQTKSLSNSGDSDTEDSQGWRSYAQSVLQNGKQTIPDAEESLLSEHVGEEIEPFLTQFDHTNNRTLMVMRPGQTLCFRGKCLLTCLYGRVEVLGFTIEEGQQPYPLYSPASHCPLTITALADSSLSTKNRKEGRQEAKMVVRKYLSSVPRKHLLNEMDSDSCVVLLEALDNPLTRFLTSHSQLKELFGLSSKELRSDSAVDNSALSAVGLMALNSSGNQGLITSRSYRDALHRLVQVWGDDECDRCPIILVYGAKNSGKSTFVRHLINSLLNQ
ncbi:hypothetical protein AALO_G00047400 [Alosa alosa]|uniref:NOL9 N-terminal domain-containing protein n=2 Tax=Alosa alosa TaxID=278164 RepID=A0AAV6H7Q1_9TELE|nr:hypothetical protein AALO_G00047400 [Alosa alosa]